MYLKDDLTNPISLYNNSVLCLFYGAGKLLGFYRSGKAKAFILDYFEPHILV